MRGGTVSIREISKVFHAGQPNRFVALDRVSLELSLEQSTVIKGPSGSGKTTLLTILGGMSRPTSGRIFLDDRELTSLPERFLTGIRRSTFGFVFQQYNLIRGVSALENVMIPAYPLGERFAALQGRAMEKLEWLDLGKHSLTKVEHLSGGEAQRVAIARALINNPKVVIADEPTAHLDSRLAREFIDIMCRLKEVGTAVIVASHDPLLCESVLAERVVEMRDGRIVEGGKAA